MEIKGTSVIVTGAGSGMGAQTARQLAAAGAKVALFDIDKAATEAVARECGGLAVHCDVSNSDHAKQAIHAAKEVNGPARICINCAGVVSAQRIVGREGPMSLEDFSRTININLVGTFNIMRLAANEMSALEPLGESEERGVIINTASVAAYEGQIGQAAYSASKGGIVSLTLPAARELAKFGIRVMAVAPGIIGTPMLFGMPKEVQDTLAAQVPFPKRLGKTSEFADLAMHIIENQMLNGSVIRLDGAIRMAEK